MDTNGVKDGTVKVDIVDDRVVADLVGRAEADHREIDDDCVRRAAIHVDSRLAAVEESGDLVIPLTAGVITGLGVLCPIGLTLDSFWQALSEGRSGVRRVSHFDPSGLPVQIGLYTAFVPMVGGLMPVSAAPENDIVKPGSDPP